MAGKKLGHVAKQVIEGRSGLGISNKQETSPLLQLNAKEVLRGFFEMQRIFHAACLAAGYRDDPDMNSPDGEGIGAIPLNYVDGVRVSTAIGYLTPCRSRLNLTIKPNVTANKVLFEGKRAVGIAVESGGEMFELAGETIILSAGAMASPQLLMLSGTVPYTHPTPPTIRLV